jgi:protein-tyrosine-phosphatase
LAGGDRTTILFVCQHGAAKSVLAAAELGRLAAERGLAVDAVASGIEPDEAVSAAAIEALGDDAAGIGGYRPRRVTGTDIETASRVITLGVAPADLPATTRSIERWDDVPAVDAGPAAARVAIARRVRLLLGDEPPD